MAPKEKELKPIFTDEEVEDDDDLLSEDDDDLFEDDED